MSKNTRHDNVNVAAHDASHIGDALALAQRDFQIRQAQYQAEVETQKARAAQAGPLSSAQAKQAVVAEEVKQLLTTTADDINFDARSDVTSRRARSVRWTGWRSEWAATARSH